MKLGFGSMTSVTHLQCTRKSVSANQRKLPALGIQRFITEPTQAICVTSNIGPPYKIALVKIIDGFLDLLVWSCRTPDQAGVFRSQFKVSSDYAQYMG